MCGGKYLCTVGRGQILKALPVMTGSHIDLAKNGGRFDGIVGSVAALEATRVMVESGYQPATL